MGERASGRAGERAGLMRSNGINQRPDAERKPVFRLDEEETVMREKRSWKSWLKVNEGHSIDNGVGRWSREMCLAGGRAGRDGNEI